MWFEILSQEQILKTFRSLAREDVQLHLNAEQGNIRRPGSAEVLVVWSGRDARYIEHPIAFVVDDSDTKSFLAWVTTFFDQSFKPFTGYFHILPWSVCRVLFSEAGPVDSPRKDIELHRNKSKIRGAWVGAIFGEIFIEAKSIQLLETVGIQAFSSTCSFAFSRALSVYDFPADSEVAGEDILNRWLRARLITQQKARTTSREALVSVWNALKAISGKESHSASEEIQYICEACRQIMSTGNISERLWNQWLPFLDYRVIELMQSSPKEERFLALEKAASTLLRSNGSALIIDFTIGYLASLLGKSFDYAELLIQWKEEAESALIWYGICVGLRAGNQLIEGSGGLGWRLLREIERPFSIELRPDSDISLDELDMLAKGGKDFPSFSRFGNSALKVELLPGISITVSISSKRGESGSDYSQMVTESDEIEQQGDRKGIYQLPHSEPSVEDEPRIKSADIIAAIEELTDLMNSRFDEVANVFKTQSSDSLVEASSPQTKKKAQPGKAKNSLSSNNASKKSKPKGRSLRRR